jgi:hypothetical protein
LKAGQEKAYRRVKGWVVAAYPTLKPLQSGWMARLRLYFHTLRYLRPHQLYARVWVEGKRFLGIHRKVPVPGLLQARGERNLTPWIHHDPWNQVEDLRRGHFVFLDQACDLGWLPEWKRAQQTPLLWQFHLHYQHYLHLLTPSEQELLCQHWIAAHPLGAPVAWHPYTTSLRLVNWVQAGVSSPALLASLYEQAAYLYRNLESYHPGNHYLENARALIFCGLYLQGQGESGRWLERGCHIVEQEIEHQILADGGYFELSPMYHCLMLEWCLDLCNLLPPDGELARRLGSKIPRMIDFLQAVTHPQGEIALFNDSTVELAPSPQALLDYARRLGFEGSRDSGAFEQSGYFVHRDPECYLIVDAGPIGPNELPAHAHADIFSLEFSWQGQKVLVDTGVFEYRKGPLRDWARSTLAHNTVAIDGCSQAEVWGSFRVGRRYPPQAVRYRAWQKGFLVEGRFAGWAQLIGDDLVHRRQVEFDGRTLTLTDQVDGRGNHRVSIPLHIGPDYRVEPISSRQVRLLSCKNQLIVRAEAPIWVEEADYSPRFGQRIPIFRIWVEYSNIWPILHRWRVECVSDFLDRGVEST